MLYATCHIHVLIEMVVNLLLDLEFNQNREPNINSLKVFLIK
jgi:hypothetical protein